MLIQAPTSEMPDVETAAAVTDKHDEQKQQQRPDSATSVQVMSNHARQRGGTVVSSGDGIQTALELAVMKDEKVLSEEEEYERFWTRFNHISAVVSRAVLYVLLCAVWILYIVYGVKGYLDEGDPTTGEPGNVATHVRYLMRHSGMPDTTGHTAPGGAPATMCRLYICHMSDKPIDVTVTATDFGVSDKNSSAECEPAGDGPCESEDTVATRPVPIATFSQCVDVTLNSDMGGLNMSVTVPETTGDVGLTLIIAPADERPAFFNTVTESGERMPVVGSVFGIHKITGSNTTVILKSIQRVPQGLVSADCRTNDPPSAGANTCLLKCVARAGKTIQSCPKVATCTPNNVTNAIDACNRECSYEKCYTDLLAYTLDTDGEQPTALDGGGTITISIKLADFFYIEIIRQDRHIPLNRILLDIIILFVALFGFSAYSFVNLVTGRYSKQDFISIFLNEKNTVDVESDEKEVG